MTSSSGWAHQRTLWGAVVTSLERSLVLLVPDRIRRWVFRNRLVWGLRNRFAQTRTVAMQRPLEGFFMRLPASYVRAYGVGAVEPQVVRYIQEHVKRGSVVADVGAFAGYYSLLLSRVVGERGRVHAFEPVAENFRLLEHNMRINARSNVQANAFAVGSRDGRAVFRRNRGYFMPYGSLVHDAEPTRYADLEVELRSLDGYFADLGWPRLSLVKIDVEGAEAHVIFGMQELIKRHSPVLLIEIHDRAAHNQEEARRVLPALFDCGYRIFVLDEDPDLRHPLAAPELWSGHTHCVALRGT